MAIKNENTINVYGATLTRRELVKAGGALLVGFGIAGAAVTKKSTVAKNSLDPSLPSSWIEIHPDNTILIRTGKSDFGQGTTFTAYRQIVAEELNARFDDITTVLMGDTDRTPDGSGAFDFLGRGTPNIRKAAAYTYQALLELASHRLGVPKDQISVKDGVVSGGGKTMTYGELVKGQQLKLTIPVTGELTSIGGLAVAGSPPMKPVSEYTVIGKSHKNSVIASKVTAREKWATDVRLPGMLHARMVHPEDARLHARFRWRAGQEPLPQRAGGRQRQSCRRRCAHRMGSDPCFAAGRGRHEMDRVEGSPRQCKALRPFASRPTSRARRSARATRPRATCRPR